MRNRHEVERVLELHAAGWNASAIARATRIPRSSVRDWVAGRLPRSILDAEHCERGSGCTRGRLYFDDSYAYVLGMYLGDGCISELRRGVHSLRIALDSRYPELIFECRCRVGIVNPANQVSSVPMSGGARGVVVQSYSKHWPCLFPQHGRGKKHERAINLDAWQQAIVDAYPEMFLRGLVHSDGCRNINNRGRGSRWTGVRYTFSNRSDDIRALFTETCDRLGIHWTTPDVYTISVARRAIPLGWMSSSGLRGR